jgi:hypothetical protein
MDTLSNTCYICDQCGERYAPRQVIKPYKDKHFCSFICRGDYIEYKDVEHPAVQPELQFMGEAVEA